MIKKSQLTRSLSSLVQSTSNIQKFAVSSLTARHGALGKISTACEFPNKVASSQHFDIFFEDFLATVSDECCIFVGNNFCWNHIALKECKKQVELENICIVIKWKEKQMPIMRLVIIENELTLMKSASNVNNCAININSTANHVLGINTRSDVDVLPWAALKKVQKRDQKLYSLEVQTRT